MWGKSVCFVCLKEKKILAHVLDFLNHQIQIWVSISKKKSSICWARIMSNNLDPCLSPSLAQDFAPSTITSLSELNGLNHVPAEEEWRVLCIGWKAARRWKHSSAFKALPLPPCAFVFYPGRFSSLLLKACLMYADSSVYVCVWDRSRENKSNKRVLLR